MIGYIYQIRNLKNGKIYVGSTDNPKERWDSHRWKLSGDSHHNDHLQNTYNRHGIDIFIFEIIHTQEVKDREELYDIEDKWIIKTDCLNPEVGYNLKLGSHGPVHSPETLEKMRMANYGKFNPFYGKHHTDEAKEKMSESHKGMQPRLGAILSPEAKQKIGDAHRGMKATEEHILANRNAGRSTDKAVIRLSEPVVEYSTIGEACRQNSIKNTTNLVAHLKGKTATCGGYKWKYKS